MLQEALTTTRGGRVPSRRTLPLRGLCTGLRHTHLPGTPGPRSTSSQGSMLPVTNIKPCLIGYIYLMRYEIYHQVSTTVIISKLY